MAILIGGIIPALLFGLAGVFQKASTNFGITTGAYLICIGIGVCLTGIIITAISREININLHSASFAFLIGIAWSLGMGLVAIALNRYSASLATLVPLYNMNTLVAVVLALIIFAEWKDVSTAKLLAGTLLITVGGTLVANS